MALSKKSKVTAPVVTSSEDAGMEELEGSSLAPLPVADNTVKTLAALQDTLVNPNKATYSTPLTIQQKLLVPFTEEDISVGDDGFDYVDPEKYRARLHEIFPGGYSFTATVHQIVKLDEQGLFGLEGIGRFSVHVDDDGSGKPYYASVSRTVFEEFILGAQDFNKGKIQKASQTYSMFASAALKAVATELGIGQHLYHKEAKKSEKGLAKRKGKSTSTSTPAAAPSTSAPTASVAAPVNTPASPAEPPKQYGPWDGTVVIKNENSKNHGKMWKDLDENTINFLVTKDNNFAKLERARRDEAIMSNATPVKSADKLPF